MFEPIQFMQPLRDFLAAADSPCKGLSIALLRADCRGPGHLLDSRGAALPQFATDLLGNCLQRQRILFTLGLALGREQADSVLNLAAWVNYQDHLRGTAEQHPLLPAFGQKDRLTAFGGGARPRQDQSRYTYHLHLQAEFETLWERKL